MGLQTGGNICLSLSSRRDFSPIEQALRDVLQIVQRTFNDL
jgi:hypothetical protein